MKKNTVLISLVLLLAALCAAASAGEGVPVDEEHFPNDRFRAYVAENKDLDGDGILSAEEIESADTIGIYDSFLESLEGVEYFTNLQHLICFSNQYLKKLDVSKNTRLEELDCHNCQLSSLKLGGCQNLKKLHCETNRLKSLDVSGCTALEELRCDENPLERLDVSHNARLTVLTCGTCRLTAVDVSGCPELGVLFCANNQLTGIDTSRLSKLWKLNVYGNRLTSLDLNGNLALKELGCSYNSLSALDLSPCRDLEIVDCAFNGLTTLDLSANKALKELCCDGNRLDKLDVSCCARLYHLQCNDNRLTGLDVSNNTALQALYCRNNRLDALNVSWNKKLVGLSCDGNHLTALDVANNTKLQYLNCSGNQLFYMDLTGNRNLRDFSCETRLEIRVTGRRFDLTQIEGFRYKKAADWTGGAVKGSTLTVAGETVTCRIKCGRGFTIAVELLPSFVKASLSSAKLAYTSKVYTGGAWEPAVTVKSKVNGKTYTLDPDEDYTVTYRNNIKAGTATVTIKGRGHYKGTLTKKFVIKPVKILKVSLSNSKLPYTGKARKPIPTVTTKVDGRLVTLVKNTDYTVKYENNVEIGTATVTVTGKGNYTGTIKKTFTITEKQ